VDPAAPSASPGPTRLGVTGSEEGSRLWGVGYALVAVLLAAPALVVRYPPVLDLAQLTSQVRLFDQVLGGLSGYSIQWLAPDKIGYLPVAAGWWIGGADWGPRLGLAFAIAIGVGAVFLLARRVGAPLEHAALAAVFVLGRPLHVGLLNFVVGSLPFFFWIEELRCPVARGGGSRALLRAFIFGWLLYFSHALLLAGALGLTLVAAWRRRPDLRTLALRLAGLTPAFVACAIWYRGLAAAGWKSQMHWILGPGQRLLEPRVWRLYLLGVVQGPEEPMLLAAVAIWALLCVAGTRGRPWPPASGTLLRFAACMAAVAWLFPEGVGNTVYFAQRWAPLAVILALLALPRARVRRRLASVFALAVVVSWSAVLGASWRGFDRQEMRGFPATLAKLPKGARVLTLDFLRITPRFLFLPFFQMGGYAEIERDAVPATSFADLPTSPVVHRELPRDVPWTPRLENYPLGLAASDLRYFDDILLHADPETRDRLVARFPVLSVAAGDGFWWLLAVRPPGSAAPAQGAEPR
jgi:hypothetical protein